MQYLNSYLHDTFNATNARFTRNVQCNGMYLSQKTTQVPVQPYMLLLKYLCILARKTFLLS